jgi:hypothetical protein
MECLEGSLFEEGSTRRWGRIINDALKWVRCYWIRKVRDVRKAESAALPSTWPIWIGEWSEGDWYGFFPIWSGVVFYSRNSELKVHLNYDPQHSLITRPHSLESSLTDPSWRLEFHTIRWWVLRREWSWFWGTCGNRQYESITEEICDPSNSTT